MDGNTRQYGRIHMTAIGVEIMNELLNSNEPLTVDQVNRIRNVVRNIQDSSKSDDYYVYQWLEGRAVQDRMAAIMLGVLDFLDDIPVRMD